jgi:hypothetical protein
VRRSFDLLSERGIRLSSTRLGRPMLGVKTGCNEAFVLDGAPGDDDPPPRRRPAVQVEPSMLRPAFRGEDIRAWMPARRRASIIWTHDAIGTPMRRLPPRSEAWLARHRAALEARADAARGGRWWSLFRTDGADARTARVVWSDISRVPRALVLEPGDPAVPLNTCYVLRARSSDEAHAFAALLNSPLAAAWLVALAEPARGGYRRFLAWTIARLPIPASWERAVEILAPIGRRAAAGHPPDARSLTVAAARAYGIRPSRLEPMLAWCRR